MCSLGEVSGFGFCAEADEKARRQKGSEDHVVVSLWYSLQVNRSLRSERGSNVQKLRNSSCLLQLVSHAVDRANSVFIATGLGELPAHILDVAVVSGQGHGQVR